MWFIYIIVGAVALYALFSLFAVGSMAVDAEKETKKNGGASPLGILILVIVGIALFIALIAS